MVGIANNQIRYAFVAEVTPGTTPSTPGFLTTHTPVMRVEETTRYHQGSQVAGGALLGDTLMTKKSMLKITDAPVVYGLYDPILETLFQGSWSSNVLIDGKTRKTVSCEKSFPAGLAGTTNYMRDTGVEAIGGSMSFAADSPVTMSLDLMGMASGDPVTSAISGATYTDPSNNDAFSAAVDMGAVTLAGYTLDGVSKVDIDFSFEGREPQAIAGTTLYGITRGACRVKATFRVYIDTNFAAAYNAARQATSQTAALFTVNFGSVTAKKYKLELLKGYIDSAPIDFSSATGFVDVTIVGSYSTSDTAVMKLTRAIA